MVFLDSHNFCTAYFIKTYRLNTVKYYNSQSKNQYTILLKTLNRFKAKWTEILKWKIN